MKTRQWLLASQVMNCTGGAYRSAYAADGTRLEDDGDTCMSLACSRCPPPLLETDPRAFLTHLTNGHRRHQTVDSDPLEEYALTAAQRSGRW